MIAEDLKPQGPPAELLRLCPEAAALWPKLFRSADFKMLYNFGFDDLMFRLTCQITREQRRGVSPDYRQRARIWYHVNAASAKGSSDIPDLTESNILAWMPDLTESKTVSVNCLTCGKRFQQKRGSKFGSCQKCRGNRLKAKSVAKQVAVVGELPEGWKMCLTCQQPFEAKRSDAQYCQNKNCQSTRAAAKQKAMRERKKASGRSPVVIIPVESYVSQSSVTD